MYNIETTMYVTTPAQLKIEVQHFFTKHNCISGGGRLQLKKGNDIILGV